MFDRRLLSNFDWVLCGIVLLICLIGVIAIHSATIGAPEMAFYKVRQIYWILLGSGVALATTLIHYRTLAQWGYFLHFGVIILLVLVLLFGVGGPGTPVKRWLAVGPFFIQPSEFAKYTLILILAHHFRERRFIGNLGFLKLMWPTMMVMIPFVLILKQPDLGTALLLMIVFVPIIFLVGIRKVTMLLTAFISAVLALVAWYGIPSLFGPILKSYQKNRILTFINPDLDPLGAGYQVIQSMIAIGSGQIWGKGFEQGTQGQLNFLPAHHTDFIFSVFSEEWGFIGGVTILMLFLFLILWALSGVLKTNDRSSAILVVGIVSVITSHVMINIGMVLGLMPVVGVPLPFFSYGGSSMLSMMFGIGLLLNIRMRRFQNK
ncbi:MAG: rod shape-determining protein RodA [SAR324 cluster bacterium]|nr:rod shape-determining protein RodA [SAR324 cluster bacterium]